MERILQCVPGNMDIGGIETFLMAIYRNIDREKFQFDFIVHSEKTSYFENEILKMGGRVFHLKNKSKNFTDYRRQYLEVISRYRIVHIHAVYSFSFFEARWAKTNGKTVILHSHNAKASLKRSILHYVLKPLLNQYIDIAVAPSRMAAKWMFTRHNLRQKYVTLYNGFDLKKFMFSNSDRRKTRKMLGISNNTFLVLVVGRLARQKDPEFAIKVFSAFLKSCPDACLVFAGDGNLRSRMITLSNELKIEKKVKFVGSVSNVSSILSAADAFLLSTRYEGLGIAIVEAQVNGLDVITSKSVPQEAVVTGKAIQLTKLSKRLWTAELKKVAGRGFNEMDRRISIHEFSNYDIGEVTNNLMNIYKNLGEG